MLGQSRKVLKISGVSQLVNVDNRQGRILEGQADEAGTDESCASGNDNFHSASIVLSTESGELRRVSAACYHCGMVPGLCVLVAMMACAQQSAVDQPAGVRGGSDIRAPFVIAKPKPEYTQEARLAKLEGSVL